MIIAVNDLLTIQQTHALTPQQLNLYAALLSFYNKTTGKCYPSREQLAERASMTPTVVSRHLTALASLGIISKVFSLIYRRNQYSLNVLPPTLAERQNAPETPAPQRCAEKRTSENAQNATCNKPQSNKPLNLNLNCNYSEAAAAAAEAAQKLFESETVPELLKEFISQPVWGRFRKCHHKRKTVFKDIYELLSYVSGFADWVDKCEAEKVVPIRPVKTMCPMVATFDELKCQLEIFRNNPRPDLFWSPDNPMSFETFRDWNRAKGILSADWRASYCAYLRSLLRRDICPKGQARYLAGQAAYKEAQASKVVANF